MTIYVITAQDIEDHWPDVAFSTLEKAKEYLASHPIEFNDHRYIQPLELDTGKQSVYEEAIYP